MIQLKILQKIGHAHAYAQGRGHIKNDIPCQDRAVSWVNPNKNFGISVLADGAGSCALSHIGAEITTQKVIEIIRDNFDKLLLVSPNKIKKFVISHIWEELRKYASLNNVPIKELSSTLLFVAVKGSKYLAGHLGDGVIGYSNLNDIKVLSKPENGEFSNVTFFTTSKSAPKKLRIYKGALAHMDGFILMSDGAEESLYDKKNNTLVTVNNEIINWLKNHSSEDVSKALKTNLTDFMIQKTFDDCSLGILHITKNNNVSKLESLNIENQKCVLNLRHATAVKNRVKILHAIQNLNSTNAIVLAQATHLTPKTITNHIKALVQDGILIS